MYETLDLERLLEDQRFDDYDKESVNAIFDLSQSITEEKFQPSAAKPDANEPELLLASVRPPTRPPHWR